MVCFPQMISNFSSIKIRLVLLLLALVLFSCKSTEQKNPRTLSGLQGQSSDTLYARCSNEVCSLLTVGKAGHETLVAEAPGNTVIERLNDSIYRAVASCGSPCSGAFYFDARSGRKAGFYPDWLVEDTLHLLIAYLDSTSQIVVRCIFECRDKEKRFSLPLGPSATPRTTIRNARFEGENLTVDYLAGERFDSVQAALRIPDELLTPH